MLLKIYTDKNSLVVIEDIDDIEVHNGTYLVTDKKHIVDGGFLREELVKGMEPWQQIGPDWDRGGPLPPAKYYGTGKSPELAGSMQFGDQLFAPSDIPVKFIDYRKQGQWNRLAVDFFGVAYLCNNQGKTIERILEPARGIAA